MWEIKMERMHKNSISDNKKFQNLLRQNLTTNLIVTKMSLISSHLESLHRTVKTHQCHLDDITVEKLTFPRKISQVGMYIFSASKVISGYLKPSCLKTYKST